MSAAPDSMFSEPPPLELDSELSQHVDRFVRAAIDPRDLELIECIHRASRYANLFSGGEPRLTRRAFTMGILETGLNSAERTISAAFARWLAEWGVDIPAVLFRQDNSREVRQIIATHAFMASQSIRKTIERARTYAARTTGQEFVELRHMLFALTEDPGKAFQVLGSPLEGQDLATLREYLAGQFVENAREGERAGEWRSIVLESNATMRSGPPIPPDEKIEAEEGEEPPIVTDTPAPEPDDDYRIQTDHPALEDRLQRDVFAQVLALQIRNLRQDEASPDAGAFMLHLHGRWGSGKSSVLNFIARHVQKPSGPGVPPRVVWFNAWAHNNRRPPWWPFLCAIYSSLRQDEKHPLSKEVRRRLFRRWWRWRLTADVLPYLMILAVFALILAILGTNKSSFDTGLKIVGAILTAAAAIFAYSRTLMFGSQRAAQAYADLKTDALAPVVKLFGDIVDAVEEPLVIIIDDLDRCDADYVVDLLEGIQNLFKRKPVTYVAAADRKWIVASFEKRYADFSSRISEPGRPLGYLFLEKMFQISAPMPRLTPEVQGKFLDLMTVGGSEAAEAISEDVRKAARETLGGLHTEAELQAAIEQVPNEDAARKQAFREQAAIQITTPSAQARTESRLRRLLPMIEPNPRAMKRLINEVAIAQSRGFLESRFIPAEARARWVMLSLRWPQLADLFAEHPASVLPWRPLAEGEEPRGPFEISELPDWMQPLARSKAVGATIGADGEPGALDEAVLLKLLA
ncbi:MAG TPA: P-loop NTPase fold protein [Sphingomicrobium sp.]|nr:P-loop NTPase fold protein [Sphingomicrobium sp.]